MYKSATSDEIDFNRGSLTKNTAYFEVEAIFKRLANAQGSKSRE